MIITDFLGYMREMVFLLLMFSSKQNFQEKWEGKTCQSQIWKSTIRSLSWNTEDCPWGCHSHRLYFDLSPDVHQDAERSPTPGPWSISLYPGVLCIKMTQGLVETRLDPKNIINSLKRKILQASKVDVIREEGSK